MSISQKIKEIEISNLILWTENPRDPINESGYDDLKIITRAIQDNKKKWDLPKLIKEMGDYYDLSELPTVVPAEGKYIVYDGNRRVAILKYLQNPQWANKIEQRLFPSREPKSLKELTKVPCNICDKDTAIKNVYRKHGEKGSWGELERHYFECNFMGEPKTLFMKLDEQTKLITNNPKLNKRFVAEEVLTKSNLESIGIEISQEGIISKYKDNDLKTILEGIITAVEKEYISTRNNRGELRSALSTISPVKNLIEANKNSEKNKNTDTTITSKLTPRVSNRINEYFFGNNELSLTEGDVNNLYRDIEGLYDFYKKNVSKLSDGFPSLLRMSLRLIVETAFGKKWTTEVKDRFDKAKEKLTKDQKTTLSTQNVEKGKIVELLNIGAHNYTASRNLNQTLAMALIIGEMLKITHGKE